LYAGFDNVHRGGVANCVTRVNHVLRLAATSAGKYSLRPSREFGGYLAADATARAKGPCACGLPHTTLPSSSLSGSPPIPVVMPPASRTKRSPAAKSQGLSLYSQ